MRTAILVVLLMLPGASAGVLTWSAPDTIAADHPVFAAYTIEDVEGDLEGHVNVALQVWLDEFLLVDTAEVHEHDGAYTFVVMPPAAGTMRLVGSINAEPVEHILTVTPTTRNATGLAGLVAHRDADAWTITGDAPHMALMEFSSPSGALDARAWVSGGTLRFPGAPQAFSGIIITHPEDDVARGAIPADLSYFDNARVDLLPDTTQAPACGPSIVTDPNSLAPSGLVWQSGTTVRMLSRDGPATYLLPNGIGPDGLTTIRAEAQDPFGQFSFRPTPGPGRILVTTDSTCEITFQVVPGPGETGRLEVNPVPNPVGVSIGFAALAADGSALGHYEFDTRIMRLADEQPGRLAWAGKLHGHGGQATLHLNFLPPGDYEIVTFASPQNIDTAAVAHDGVHRLAFTMAPYGGAAELTDGSIPAWATTEIPAEPQPAQDTPLPLMVAVAAVGVALLSRRR